MVTNFDREEVRRVLQILYPAGHGVIELDVLTQTGILPGHFDDREKLLDEIEKYDGRDNVVAIYTSLNQIKPEAFKRPDHQLSIAHKVASGLRIEAADVGLDVGHVVARELRDRRAGAHLRLLGRDLPPQRHLLAHHRFQAQ